jgi:hypothetical protein
MDKINPLLYITDTDPVPEAVLDASGWFETEYITVEGVVVDTPTSSERSASYLEWFLAQGWVQYDKRSVVRYISGTTVAYNDTYYLKRRKLQAERVLNDMIREFTDAYNEGREINDSRYDELVTLYNVMLDKSEDHLGTLDTLTSDYSAVVEAIIEAMPEDYDAHKAEVDGILDDWGDSMRDEINTRFDNEAAKVQQALVDRGMSNTTLLTGMNAGIETERSKALTDLEDKIVERRLALKDRLYTLKVDVEKRVTEAHTRLLAVRQDHVLKPLEFRNAIFQAMLAMMERRTDDYPGLDGLANLAAQLGYSDGAAVVAPTAG